MDRGFDFRKEENGVRLDGSVRVSDQHIEMLAKKAAAEKSRVAKEAKQKRAREKRSPLEGLEDILACADYSVRRKNHYHWRIIKDGRQIHLLVRPILKGEYAIRMPPPMNEERVFVAVSHGNRYAVLSQTELDGNGWRVNRKLTWKDFKRYEVPEERLVEKIESLSQEQGTDPGQQPPPQPAQPTEGKAMAVDLGNNGKAEGITLECRVRVLEERISKLEADYYGRPVI